MLRPIDPRLIGGTIIGGQKDALKEKIVYLIENLNGERFQYTVSGAGSTLTDRIDMSKKNVNPNESSPFYCTCGARLRGDEIKLGCCEDCREVLSGKTESGE